jgi:type I restriction-modification system DNA methylase subunit
MSRFICQFCRHEFSLKTDLDRHLKKKMACIPITQLQIQQAQIQDKSQNVQEISGILKSCLDILRNDESHLTGDEALPELSKMMIYKQMEKLIENGTIDLKEIRNHDAILAKWGEKYEQNISFAKFSHLLSYINENSDNILNLKKIMNDFLWKTIGSNHPKLKHIFPEDGKFLIKTPQTFKELMVTLSRVDFNKFDFDILGEAYEKLFVDAIFGAGGKNKSEFGQFFTPRPVIKFLINLVELNILPNGEIESFADLSCGTGGILITAINHYRNYIHQGLITEEQLREQFKKKLFGIEIKSNLYNLCAANILLHTGEILESIILGDSIRKYWNIKVDKIVMNPPFSIKIDYDSLFIQRNDSNNIHLYMNDIMPIRVGGKNSESLFLQLMIHCLNIGGKCSTVMLDGQKIDNSSSGNREVREYLMKSCNLKSVIYCQGGTFTSTASKTCILYFTKKKERQDVLTITGTGNKRNYEFTKTHATKSVKFYDYRPEIEGNKFLLGEIQIEKIASKKYSLRFQDYEEEEDHEETEDIKWTKIGDICEFKNGKNLTRENMIEGEYPVIGGGKKPSGYHNEFNMIENTILCSSSGAYAGYINRYEIKVWASDCFSIKSTNESILLNDYLFCFLKMRQQDIYKLQTGAGQPHVYSKNIACLNIPLPIIEKQKQFIDYCNTINKNIIHTLQMIEIIRKNNENYLEICRMRFTNSKQFDLKNLSEVCKFKNGKNLKKENMIDGEYPVIGGGKNPCGYHNDFNTNENTILCSSSGAYAGYINRYITKVWASDCFSIASIDESILLDNYLFYFLKMKQNDIYKFQIGAAQPHVYSKNISNMKIPISSIEEQHNIVQFCVLQESKIIENIKLIDNLQKIIDESSENKKMFLDLLIQNFQNSNIDES